MKEDRALVFLDSADHLIDKAMTLLETKDIAGTARAVQVWARRSQRGPKIVGQAIRYQLRAERRMGEILAGMRTRGERDSGKGNRNPTLKFQNGISKPTLADLGVTGKESSRAQRLAALRCEVFERAVQEAVLRLAVSAALKFAAKEKRMQEITESEGRPQEDIPGVLPTLAEGAGKFSCIYADPPWSYGDQGCGGGLDAEYTTLDLDGICALPVGQLAKEDGAHLWMWTTWPMIRDHAPHKVLDAWGFRWVGEIVWFKGERLGVGRWLRPSTEILVLAERGKKKLERYNQRGHAFECERGKHSRKPDKFYEVIESLSEGPYIELFARRERDILNGHNRPGWSYWGKEA